jgi:hypothetical protein
VSFSIIFLGRAVDLCVLLNSAVCWEGLQVIPTVIKVRNLYGPSAILCYIEDICTFPATNKLITAKYWCCCVLPDTFQAALFQLKTPHTPTETRVSAWREPYSPLHLLIDTSGFICFLLRTANYNSPSLHATWYSPLTILCTSHTCTVMCFWYNLRGCRFPQRCVWRRVVVWELPSSSGSSGLLTAVWRQYDSSKRRKLPAKRGRGKCPP